MSFIIILLISSVTILLYLYTVLSHSGKLINKIPGPKGWPIIGNTLDVLLPLDELFKYLRFLNKKYGNLSRLYAFHCIHMVNVSNPEDVKVLLSTTRFIEKQQPYTFLRPWLGQGLLVSNGNKWAHRRKLLTPSFHFSILKQFLQIFTEHAQEFLENIQTGVDQDVNIIPLVTRATLHIMCETAMGTSMHEDMKSFANKYFNALYAVGQCVLYRIIRPILYVDWLFKFTKVFRTQKNVLKILHGFTDRIIKERELFRASNTTDLVPTDDIYSKKDRLAMLDLLLDNYKHGNIDYEGIREEVDTFMFEGHDTTAMALCFMIMRIANESEVQNLIYEEIYRVFGESDRLPTVEDLNEMKYLECCIKESLRLYPSVPLIARCINEDIVLSGYKVPAGTICQIHVFDIHRNADIFPDPEKFIPERFLPDIKNKRHPYSYIPFSAGPRNCIGQKFAMLELKTVLCGVIRNFCLEPVTKPNDIRFTTDLVLRTTQPIYVRFSNRFK